jgi:pyruvate/2-oxoglutarate dehydrogenase complex dihydrolipoamide dehydrogenase (E3) component
VPDGVDVDFAAVMRRMREVRARISPVDSVERFSEELGVDVYLGEARFATPTSIEVAGTRLRFKKAVVATGARPLLPPVPGLAEAGPLTNETVFNLRTLPPRLLVLGAGPIGCELSQAFRRFGAEVTLLEMSPNFLGQEDADATQRLRDAFERDGIDVRLETTATHVTTRDAEPRQKVVTLESKGHSETISVDEILVSAGRAPNVESLGLEQAKIDFDPQRGIVVDDQLRTSNRRVFAAGDVCLSTRFTHVAEFSARTVIQNALFFPTQRLSRLTIPWCTYTSPEIAHVGLYPRDAEAQGIEIDTWVHELSDVDRAITDGETDGFVKIHTKRGSDKILGATIVARQAGDLISEISVAMAGGMGLGRLTSVIHPYPTQADAIRQVANAYNRSRLTPTVKRLFRAVIRLKP